MVYNINYNISAVMQKYGSSYYIWAILVFKEGKIYPNTSYDL